MSEINLSTSVKYHQFLNLDDTVEFLKKECNFVQDDEFEITSSEEITFFNDEDGDYSIKLKSYIFFISSARGFLFDEVDSVFTVNDPIHAKNIIEKCRKQEEIEINDIKSKYKLNCPLSVSGHTCKALEGK